MILNVKIEKRIATLQDSENDLVCDNSKDSIVFAFDDEWDAHPNRTARFKWDGKHHDVEFTGDTVNIPSITDTRAFSVGVYSGEAAKGEEEISTTDVKIPCLLSTRSGESKPNGESGANYTNEAKGYAAEAKASAASAKASEEATADMGAEVQAHQAYYDTMAHAVAAGLFEENMVKVYPEGEKDSIGGFEKIAVLPNGLEEIKNSAFTSCNITAVRFPPSLKIIEDSAFYNNNFQGGINIPRNVESIGCEAFSRNPALTSVTFASNGKLKSIGEDAFSGTSIEGYIKIPKSVTWIGAGAFNFPLGADGKEYPTLLDLTDYGYDTPFPNVGGRLYNTAVGICVRVPKGRAEELWSMTNWSDQGSMTVYEVEV